MRVGIVGAAGDQRLDARLAELDAERGDDVARDVGLDRQDIAFRAVVALRPLFEPGPAVDQLRGDSHHAGRAPNASGEDVGDAQLLRRRPQVLVAHRFR